MFLSKNHDPYRELRAAAYKWLKLIPIDVQTRPTIAVVVMKDVLCI